MPEHEYRGIPLADIVIRYVVWTPEASDHVEGDRGG
jgi:hypothetical protein